MQFSDWWQDKRYSSERRLAVSTLSVIVVLSLVFWALWSWRPPLGSQPAEAAIPAATPAPSAPAAPQPEKAGIELAADLVIAGRLVEAERILVQREVEIFRLRGAIAWKRNDLEEARKCFQEAVARAPFSVADLGNLAGVQLQLSDLPGAVANLKTAHEADPQDAFIANRLLLARLQAGEITPVAREVDSALKAAPETSLASVAIAAAVIEMQRGDKAKAARFLRAAQSCLAPEVFDSLLVEQPLAVHANDTALAEFFRR
jgi:tetratricopeptide (TPR) repeat protein